MTKYFTAAEVATHNNKLDCWVVVFHKIINVTDVLAKVQHDLAAPIIARAGADVSHWFKQDALGSVSLKTYVDPLSNVITPYMPEGRFAHVPVPHPTTVDAPLEGLPWWQDESLVVGHVTKGLRKLRIINTLTSQTNYVEFADEETVSEMQQKFLVHNAHCRSYTWKALVEGNFKVLDPKRTLAQNGIHDDTEELERLGVDPLHPDNVTAIMLFFNDDLTIA